MVTYTTAALVRKAAEKITSSMEDTDIEAIIERNESLIDSVAQFSFKQIFDANRHGLIRDTCTVLSAIEALSSDVEQFSNSSTAALTIDILWSIADRNLGLLLDQRVISFMKSGSGE